MTMQKNDITFFEATAIIIGYGVGGGIMAVPYLSSLAGVVPLLLVLVISYGVSLLLHLMIVEMMLRDREVFQLVEIMRKYLFRGRFGTFFTWVFFGLMTLSFFGTLITYIVGSAEILSSLLNIPAWLSNTVVYIISASIVFFGLKIVGICEKYAVIAIILVIGTLSVASLGLPVRLDFDFFGGWEKTLALYGMIMFSFWSFFSIPQAAQGLSWNQKAVPWAVVAGIGINFVFILIISLMAMGVSPEVTKIAIIGWGKALGGWASLAGSILVLLAMFTSFWSVSLAFSVILQERMQWDKNRAWLAATLPCFLVALAGLSDFFGFLRLAGGVIAICGALLVVPAYLGAKKYGDIKNPVWTMGRWGQAPFLVIVVVGYLLVAVGSMIPIN